MTTSARGEDNSADEVAGFEVASGERTSADDLSAGAQRRRFVWGVIDQGFSSASNFAGTVLAARALNSEELGAIAVCMAIAYMVLTLSRSLVFEPVAIRSSRRVEFSLERTFDDALTAGALLAVLTTAGCALAGMLLSGDLRRCLYLTAVLIPVVLLQDCLRLYMFLLGRQRAAAMNDAIWLVVALVGAILSRPGRFTPVEALAVWMGAGALCGLLGIAQVGGVRPGSLRRWREQSGALSGALLADSIIANGFAYLVPVIVAALAGLSASGRLRVAQSAFGPLGIVIQGIRLQALPVLSRTAASDRREFLRTCRRTTAILMGSALLVAIGFRVMPGSIGEALFGETWAGVRGPLRWLSIWAIAATSTDIVIPAIKAAGEAMRVVRTRAVAVPLQAVLTIAMSWRWGASGAAASLTFGASLLSPVWWSMLLHPRESREPRESVSP